ncbi:MAG: glycerol kinase GlpK [Bacilli bacterium]|nr:glycerol kinase GlpK [Bacilli bacterium]
MNKYVLAIDQGTTSTRAVLIDKNGDLVNMTQIEVECTFPHSGWVETDALAIWVSVISVINELMVKENITWKNIDSIGVTNQRETTVIWDKNTGMPICPAIVWQSRQSAGICDEFEDKKDFIHERTGLLINPYFSASKIKFILDNVEGAREKANKGELLFGTVDSWIIYRMTQGKVHATDVSNASRTMLFNIKTLKWDEELCKMFGVPMSMLPKVRPSSYKYGEASFFAKGVQICGVAGDQQAALFGQTCFNVGESKNTYGTGCFMLMNIGTTPTFSKSGLLTTIAWQIGNKVVYALEGSVFIGGAVIQWLRDKMHLINTSAESEEKAYACHDTHGVYIVPAFTGLGTPYWDDDARGAIFGLTRNSSDNHIVRASLEAVAYQCKDVFEVMKNESHFELSKLKVDGGATANNYLMQFQSDILQTEIELPKCLQTTALGASYLAGLASGFFADRKHIESIHGCKKNYHPQMDVKEVEARYKGWKKAVEVTRMFK